MARLASYKETGSQATEKWPILTGDTHSAYSRPRTVCNHPYQTQVET